MHLKITCLSLSLFFLSASLLQAQIHEEVRVDLVQIFVSVFGSTESLARDLKREDFVIKENGKLQEIVYFERLLEEKGEVPLTIAFLMDTSGSMKQGERVASRLKVAKAFGSLILEEVRPSDRMQVFAFNIALWKLTEMTSDAEVIQSAFSSIPPPQESPGTALLWAVDAVSHVIENESGRKVMVLLTDGENNMTEGPKLQEVIEQLGKSNISVLALGTTDIGDWEENTSLVPVPGYDPTNIRLTDISDRKKNAKRMINLLTEKSGGYAFYPERLTELDDSMDKFRRVLQSQYVISFHPEPRSGQSWQKIDVRCKRKGIRLSYRKGYFSGPPE